MKQLKITKRQAALMLLELCHGFLILFAIYACVVVISGHGSEPFVLVGCLLFPLNAGLFLAEKKATHFWQFGIVTLLLIGGSVMLAGSGVCGIWTGILGVIAAFSYFYGRASKKTCWLKIPVVSMAWNCSGSVSSWSAFCVGYGDSDCSGSCGIILSAL